MRSVSRSPERRGDMAIPPASPGTPAAAVPPASPGAEEDDNAVRMFQTPPRPGRAAAAESPSPTVEDDVLVEDATEMGGGLRGGMGEGVDEGADEGVDEGAGGGVDEGPQGVPMAVDEPSNEPTMVPEKRLVSHWGTALDLGGVLVSRTTHGPLHDPISLTHFPAYTPTRRSTTSTMPPRPATFDQETRGNYSSKSIRYTGGSEITGGVGRIG